MSMTGENRALYESIVSEVARIIKKHLKIKLKNQMNIQHIIYESIFDDYTAEDKLSAVAQIQNSIINRPHILDVYDKAIAIKFDGMSKVMKNKEKFFEGLRQFDDMLNEVLDVLRVFKKRSKPVYRLTRGVLGLKDRYDNYIEEEGLWFERQPDAFDDSYETRNGFDVMIGVDVQLKHIEKLPEFIKQLNGISVGLI